MKRNKVLRCTSEAAGRLQQGRSPIDHMKILYSWIGHSSYSIKSRKESMEEWCRKRKCPRETIMAVKVTLVINGITDVPA